MFEGGECRSKLIISLQKHCFLLQWLFFKIENCKDVVGMMMQTGQKKKILNLKKKMIKIIANYK